MMYRFWNKVDTSGDCWEWTAYRNKGGYGKFKLSGKAETAHRLAYMFYYGTFEEDMCILHKCDNPPCVNPYHLFLGTRADNVQDMIAKGRARAVSGNNHGCRVVNSDEVREIREKYKKGTYTQRQLAEEYKIASQTVSAIINRIIWKEV